MLCISLSIAILNELCTHGYIVSAAKQSRRVTSIPCQWDEIASLRSQWHITFHLGSLYISTLGLLFFFRFLGGKWKTINLLIFIFASLVLLPTNPSTSSGQVTRINTNKTKSCLSSFMTDLPMMPPIKPEKHSHEKSWQAGEIQISGRNGNCYAIPSDWPKGDGIAQGERIQEMASAFAGITDILSGHEWGIRSRVMRKR